MFSTLKAVVGLLVMILISIATYWVNAVNADREILHDLAAKDKYLNGNLIVPTQPKK